MHHNCGNADRISSHGHPFLITPNMDRLREMGVRLENFHVDPTCSPSRAALMTDRWRLIGNTELYDMSADPGQQHNVIDLYPEIARDLSKQYDEW